jgi:hypothetical protein
VSQPADKRDAHEAEGLRDADLAVVLWGSGDVAWVEDQLRRLRRWERLGRSRALRTIALLVAGPDTDEKRHEDPMAAAELHIDLRSGLDSEALAPLNPFLRLRT